MNYFTKITSWVVKQGALVSAVFLVFNMMIVIMSIVCRFLGTALMGSYELIEVTIGVTVSFALSYTALTKDHIIINMFVGRIHGRARAIVDSVSLFISLFFLAVTVWAGYKAVGQRLITGELTAVLGISVVPFRIIWVGGVILFCMVIIMDLLTVFNKVVKK